MEQALFNPCEWYISEKPVVEPGRVENRPLRVGPFASEEECFALMQGLKGIPRFRQDDLVVFKRVRGQRVRIALPVRVYRSPSDAKPQLAYTHDVSKSGARLTGLEQAFSPGQIVEIQYGRSKVPFQVIWTGAPNSPTGSQAGLECLDPDANIWNLDFSRPMEDDPLLHEVMVARSVQRKLLPQEKPLLQTLEYAADCIQAGNVGGDYYDFLDMGPGKAGFVMADVSGKGISAALLMANLQGCLFADYNIASQDLSRLLGYVNRHLYEHTEKQHYATVFLGSYSDATRTLEYVNCGHCPPLLLHAQGEIERLEANATVLGLFRDWSCSVSHASMEPGATLVIFTDGVTEARNSSGEEYGDRRLLQCVREAGSLPVDSMLRNIVSGVESFRVGEQEDDLTLLIARAL